MDDHKPPAWVHKRDGRLVPFESDKISRALFAAAEEIGAADAFLARELADSVVFFLSQDTEGSIPTTAQIADLVVKVVRELGQPALATAFTAGSARKPQGPRPERREGPPPEEIVYRFSTATSLGLVLRDVQRLHGLASVYSRDLAAVHADGLLTMVGAGDPYFLAACVWSPPSADHGIKESLDQANSVTNRTIAIDGLEYTVAASSVADVIRDLENGLGPSLTAVINLNTTSPPSWADNLAAGPLFVTSESALSPERRTDLSVALSEPLVLGLLLHGRARVDWHIGERDVQPDRRERLVHLVRLALRGAGLAFTFTRPRQPVALAEGLDRELSTVLLRVGLQLPRLLEATRGGDAELFLHKLGSLARLALSAGVQKREFLRQRKPEITRGFLLERARLVVVPVGLDSVVRRVHGQSLSSGGAALDFALKVVQRLQGILHQDGEACRLMTCLDGIPTPCPAMPLLWPREEMPGSDPSASEFVAGLTACDPTVPIKGQIRSAGAMHAIAGGGTAFLLLPRETPPDAEQLADWLIWAWRRTDLVRCQIVIPPDS